MSNHDLLTESHCHKDEGEDRRHDRGMRTHRRPWQQRRTGSRNDGIRSGDHHHGPERQHTETQFRLRRRCSDLQSQLDAARAEIELEKKRIRELELCGRQINDLESIATFQTLDTCVSDVASQLMCTVAHPVALAVPLHAASVSALLARGRVPSALHPLLSLAADTGTVRASDIFAPLCRAAIHTVFHNSIFAPFLPGFPQNSPLDALYEHISTQESCEQAEHWRAMTYRAALFTRTTNKLAAHLAALLAGLLAELLVAVLPAGTCTIPSDLDAHAQSLVRTALQWQDAAGSTERNQIETFLPAPQAHVLIDTMQVVDIRTDTLDAGDDLEDQGNKIVLIPVSPGLRKRGNGAVILKAKVVAIYYDSEEL